MTSLPKGLFRFIRIALSLILILVSLWALYLPPLFPSSTYALVNSGTYEITSPVTGTIDQVAVIEKQFVEPETRVAIIQRDQEIILAEIKAWQLKIEQLQKRLNAIEKTIVEQRKSLLYDQQDKQKLLTADYNEATKRLAAIKSEYQVKVKNQKHLKSLFDQGIITLAQWKQTELDVLQSEKELSSTRNEISKLNTELNTINKNLASTQNTEADTALTSNVILAQEMRSFNLEKTSLNAEIHSLQQKIQDSLQHLEQGRSYEITNPANGVVWYTRVVSGQAVTQGQPLFEIATADSLFVEAYLGRHFLDSISIGDNVSIYLNRTQKFYEGTVQEIQLQEHSDTHGYAISSIPPDKSVLKVLIKLKAGDINLDHLGNLAKVIITNPNPSLAERFLVWLSLTLRSHT